MSPDWDAAVALLEGADEVVLACHVDPDGDALGSALALGVALRDAGRRVCVSFGSSPASAPLTVPSAYAFLPGQELLVPPAAVPPAPRLLVTLDTGSADRLGTLADRCTGGGEVLVVDHHVTNTRYGTCHLVDPSAAATAVVVDGLLTRLGLPLTRDVATALYTGLTTDTGSFRYAATTASVHELAARLLATGIRHDLISRAVFDTHSHAWVRLLGAVLTRSVLEPSAAAGRGLVWTSVTGADLAEHGLALEDVEGVIDVLRTAAEAEVAVVVKEAPDGTLRVSTRSQGAVDLGAVCVGLGGGGHRYAAGFSAPAGVEAVLDRLRAALEAAPVLPA